MVGHILAVNAGSSSLKLSLFDDNFKLVNKRTDSVDSDKTRDEAFERFIHSNEKDMQDIEFVVHRVVHGKGYREPLEINKETLHHLEALNDLAPLHNAGALSLVKISVHRLADTKNFAMFDTIFHRHIPEEIYTYPLDPKLAGQNGLRKYGFHGISYGSILRSVAGYYNVHKSKLNLIVLHLGSGASACCIRGGRSLDTSMGFTPLEGLFGASRSGSLDPALYDHYPSDQGAEEVFNKQAGWKALASTSDFGEIAKCNTEKTRLAFNMFCDRIVGYVASYYVKLNGNVTALVFSGGIGEASEPLRAKVVEGVQCLGFRLNNQASSDKDVSPIGDKVLVCKTDEAREMARIIKRGEM